MSHAIIKGLRIEADKFFLKASSNNVSPRHYRWEESESLSNILNRDGKKEVIKTILYEYWGGMFQGGENLFDKTIQLNKNKLHYNWLNTGDTDEVGKQKYSDEKEIVRYTHNEVKEALYQKYLEYKNRDTRFKYAVRYKGNLVCRKTARYIFFANSIDTAKMFNSYEDAELFTYKLYSKETLIERIN